MARPAWLALLAPIPQHVAAERKPVASAQQIADGTAGPIAGWQSVTVHLSEPDFGLRHLQVTLDAEGRLVSGGDHVMVVRDTSPDGLEATLTDHESIGGRFEVDGSFNGTHWKTTLETVEGQDDSVPRDAVSRLPTEAEVAALRRLIDDVLLRGASSAPSED